jgi:hypothetical protein
MADLGGLSGIPSMAYEYAAADFPDADQNEHSSFVFFDSTTNTTNSVSYTTLLNNMLDRHTYEIREKSQTAPLTSSQWRRRFREFLTLRVKEILMFATKPLAKHPTLGPVDVLLRKFGRPNFVANHHTLREVALDASGVNLMGMIEEGLKQFPHTLKGFQEQTRYLCDMYRESADEILRQDTILQARLAMFDKIQIRLTGFTELQVNEDYEPMALATEAYLKRVFDEHSLEPIYKALIEAYRKFFLLREMVHLRQLADAIDAQPLCNICFEEAIQFTITPCGHTYCGSCIKKQFTACYICRGPIRERVRLFLG